MQSQGVLPNTCTFICLLKACAILLRIEDGRRLHSELTFRGSESDAFIKSSLIKMYGKCTSTLDAENVFASAGIADTVSWNTMLSVYVEIKYAQKVLLLYRQMVQEGVSPDGHTFSMVIQATYMMHLEIGKHDDFGCKTDLRFLEIGRALHADARKIGFASDSFVVTALLTMYSKCGGGILDITNIFDSSTITDVTLWNALISAYVEQGQAQKALHLYKIIRKQGVIMDEISVTCLLQACADVGCLLLSRELHFALVCAGIDLDCVLTATLIDTYRSCSTLVDGNEVFVYLVQPDVVSWTACIAGYAREGNPWRSLELFMIFLQQKCIPDGVMFGSVIAACSLGGLVDEGLHVIEYMQRKYGVIPDMKLFNLIIDLLGRAGDFNKTENLMGKISSNADPNIWLSLLGACYMHGNKELGKMAYGHLVKLHPEETIAYVLMSNICSDI